MGDAVLPAGFWDVVLPTGLWDVVLSDPGGIKLNALPVRVLRQVPFAFFAELLALPNPNRRLTPIPRHGSLAVPSNGSLMLCRMQLEATPRDRRGVCVCVF